MASGGVDPRWVQAAQDAQRAFKLSDAVVHRWATGGRPAYLDQIDRIREQTEGPAKQYLEVADRARAALAGPASQSLEFVEKVNRALDEPARRYAEFANQVQRVLEGPAKQYLEFGERIQRSVEAPLNRSAEFAQRMTDAIEAPLGRMADVAEQARLAVEGPAQRMHEHYVRLNRILDGYDLGAILEQVEKLGENVRTAIQESMPANWRALAIEDVERVDRLVREEGVPLVWVPGADLTGRVASAVDRPAAMSVLLGEQSRVLVDIEEVLHEITAPDLRILADKTRAAVAALRDNHGDAAQALAAAVFTSALHDGLGHKELRDVRAEAQRNPSDQASLSAYRGALVTELAARYVQGRGYELPGFNRSTTLHSVEAQQYSAENNLAAVMAAASVLREAQARRTGP